MLTPQHIESYIAYIKNPKEYGLDMKPLVDVFEPTEVVTASHTLAELYHTHVNNNVPIIVLYIAYDRFFSHLKGVTIEGLAGFRMKIKSE